MSDSNDHIYAERVWRGENQPGSGFQWWRVTARLHRLGLQAPYLSITFDSKDMGGCCHEECARLAPECAPFIQWHLTSPKGPMHYAANALYWAGLESYRDGNGILAFRRSPWCDARGYGYSSNRDNPPNWDHFASTIVLGGVPGDPTIDELRARWDAMASPGADVYDFITGRLERLRAAFAHAMHACFEDQPAGVLAAFEYRRGCSPSGGDAMTRRQMDSAAQLVRESDLTPATRLIIAEYFGHLFTLYNPHFQAPRFFKACGLPVPAAKCDSEHADIGGPTYRCQLARGHKGAHVDTRNPLHPSWGA